MSRSKLKAISENVKKNKYAFSPVDPSLLERFTAPSSQLELTIDVPEFTTLCPITGQPDFGKLTISYSPGLWCVESKSLKLYLMSYRQSGAFHEQCVTQIGRHLEELLVPRRLSVQGLFGARGGIAFASTYYKAK